MSKNTKLLYRWLGPYRVRDANQLKGSYALEELDGTPVKRTYAGNRLKRFIKRDGYWCSPESDEEDEPIEVVKFHEDSADEEEETAKEFRDRESTQEIVKETGIFVRVKEIPESERHKYVRFEDDWKDEESANENNTIENQAL